MTGRDLDRAEIRQATEKDAERLSLVASATFLETFAGEIDGDALIAYCEQANATAFLGQLLADGAQAWLAQIDRGPVGYSLLKKPELDGARPGDIELKKIYVLSRFHGSGIASKLFDATLAGAQGHQRLLLGVKADNHRAIAFYVKQGFAQIGTRQFDVGGALYDDVVMARELYRD